MTKLTWNDVEEELTYLGFSVSNWQSNGNLYSCDIQKYSPAGQDCNFTLEMQKDDPTSVLKALDDLYENYDPDKETMLWVGEDGHGKNGAPYHLSDVLNDMKAVQKDLENVRDDMAFFIETLDIDFSKAEVKSEFLNALIQLNGTQPIEEKNAIGLCKQTADYVINKGVGSPRQKKELLNEYLKEIGITDSNPQTYTKALNKAVSENQKEIAHEKMKENCRNHVLVTTKPEMSSTQIKVHKMFDRLFNDSETNPVEYASFVLDAGPDAPVNQFRGEKWWEKAVEHAVNSGGELWQDSSERVNLMGKAGLIDGKNEERYIDQADKLYGNYMHMYLKDLDVLDNKARDRKIATYEKNHESSLGR
ncbi:hypothetical protein [Treponema pectinovorum]|uniref:hypothetical protein n=1 Tax=Treponema pectinovorum TaxID=164 RepID=UPI0011F3B9E4|nr:hypothetical protein [Treponema pectinovorum]